MTTASEHPVRRPPVSGFPRGPSSSTRLSVTVRRQDGWTVLVLRGELDLGTLEALEETFTEQVMVSQGRGDRPAVALEMSRVTFCDSSGLNALLRSWKAIRNAEGRLVLVAPARQLARLLQTTGLDRRLPVRPELPHAPELPDASELPDVAVGQ
ncbi:STAS domain-containing protein [Actinomadura viridis]|uniref:STAS domain-containing protein n=1 Tax=Actinomadura viridis TaxID=58110 RepID=UPI0036C16E18